VLKLIDEAIDAAVAAVPGCGQLPTLTRGRPVDTSAELQLHEALTAGDAKRKRSACARHSPCHSRTRGGGRQHDQSGRPPPDGAR
jgi:hypothetical protein